MTEDQYEATEGEGAQEGTTQEGSGVPQAAPNDPEQSGEAAELSDEQKAALESGEATQGDQGPQVREQDARPVGGEVAGFDPNRPVADSPPPPDAQSGVPQIPDGSNAGVEPGEPGAVEPGGAAGSPTPAPQE